MFDPAMALTGPDFDTATSAIGITVTVMSAEFVVPWPSVVV